MSLIEALNMSVICISIFQRGLVQRLDFGVLSSRGSLIELLLLSDIRSEDWFILIVDCLLIRFKTAVLSFADAAWTLPGLVTLDCFYSF